MRVKRCTGCRGAPFNLERSPCQNTPLYLPGRPPSPRSSCTRLCRSRFECRRSRSWHARHQTLDKSPILVLSTCNRKRCHHSRVCHLVAIPFLPKHPHLNPPRPHLCPPSNPPERHALRLPLHITHHVRFNRRFNPRHPVPPRIHPLAFTPPRRFCALGCQATSGCLTLRTARLLQDGSRTRMRQRSRGQLRCGQRS